MATEREILLQKIKDHSHSGPGAEWYKTWFEEQLADAETFAGNFTVLIADGVEQVCPISLAILITGLMNRIEDLESDLQNVISRLN